jgi:hypothetical protein
MLKTKINQTYAVEITDFLQSVYLKGSDFWIFLSYLHFNSVYICL